MDSVRDFCAFLPQMVRVLRGSPLLSLCIVGLDTAACFLTRGEMLAGLLSTVLTMLLIARAIRVSLPEEGYTGEISSGRIEIGFAANILGVSMVYGIVSCFLLLLLVIPGIWWMLRFCLGQVVVVAERRQIFASLGASKRITAGHAMEVLGYFWFPLAVIVGYLGLGLVAGYVYSLVGLKSNIIASGATAVLSNVWELLLELAIVRMQVKLYMQLTKSGPELTPAG